MNILVDFKTELKKPSFWITVLSCVLALVGLIMYFAVGKTQYNSFKLATSMIVMLIIAMVLFVASMALDIRFLRYGAAVAMLYAFLKYFISEINFWSNWIIATDPVDPAVLTQYFVITILIFVATTGAFVGAVMTKKQYYKANEQSEEAAQ